MFENNLSNLFTHCAMYTWLISIEIGFIMFTWRALQISYAEEPTYSWVATNINMI